jgi:tetratricopeptide (TPR) repeat protein
MGKLYDDSKNKNKAIEYFEKFLEIDFDKQVVLWLVSEYNDRKNNNKVLSYSNMILEKNANDADATYFKALALFNQGNKSAAKNEFKKIENNSKYGPSAKQYIKSIDSN